MTMTASLPPTKQTARDPVCGMVVTLTTAKPIHTTVHRGKTYYFCSNGCKEKFMAHPAAYTQLLAIGWRKMLMKVKKYRQRYAQKDLTASPPSAADTKILYTCPMHPNVVSPKPDSCPHCGMALELVASATTSQADIAASELAEKRQTQRIYHKLLLASGCTIPVMLIEMIPPIGAAIPHSSLITLLLTTVVIFKAGDFIFTRAFTALRNAKMNMFTLISLGTSVAYLYSALTLLIAYIRPQLIPELARGSSGKINLYFETAATIITLVILGQLLEEAARRRTLSALKDLIALAPPTALRVKKSPQTPVNDKNIDQEIIEAAEEVPLTTVTHGDWLLVQPGAKVPVDGKIIQGSSYIDEAFFSGEPIAVKKSVHDSVLGGTLNTTGAFIFQAEKIGTETFLSEMIALTTHAAKSRPPVEDFTERIVNVFIPAVLIIAFLSFGVWWGWGPAPAFAYGLLACVSVLIIACPCALGLATPMAVTVGISRGAKEGVLIRDAALLEQFSAVSLIAIDKTGTLTSGRPEVTAYYPHAHFVTSHQAQSPSPAAPQANVVPTHPLQLAASLEAFSEHPLAKGVLKLAKQHKTPLLPVTDFQAHLGEGVSGKIHSTTYQLGSAELMSSLGLDTRTWQETHLPPQTTPTTTGTYLYLAGPLPADNASSSPSLTILALLILKDTIKPQAAATVAAFKRKNIRVVLLSGDRNENCAEVAEALSLAEFHGQLKPDDKYDWIKKFQQQGHNVLMAGDGINDAPALAAANVSVAMGSGSAVALETAHATLLKSDLSALMRLLILSKKTLRTIRSNLFLAFFYNTLAIPLAAGVLYPFLGWTLEPMLAALLMILSSLSVIGNALLLKSTSIASSLAH